ncbi:SWIM zinc finger family protein [Streptomyces meridianus]|uniref:SWIM zinc finger domain-containing protein n=1 Tax=Streptomyces meridianus TaxID=2938945 RepID=A0ABT0XDT4_9ACTN|nr:SWIM zinc finger family protein [Streptomyces meridianus]MCM2580565.1 SWIM zinc finger domain-containing protein [Streptomyces meridianus]
MTQRERWTADQVLALAPDAASRKAGSRLGAAGPWSATGTDGEAVWGLCRGSGSRPYRTVVALRGPSAEAGPACTCSCPSRKFPCKHALGLLLLWTEGPAAVGQGEPPNFAQVWLEGRSRRAARSALPEAAGAGRGADPDSSRRKQARRAGRMAAGAVELEQRLTDLLRGGIAGADRAGYAPWDETAARMVDAQAPGLAARVRELGSVAGSGGGWPERLLEECALLHLLDRGLLLTDGLPAPLAATVRTRAGVTTEAADVLADPGARVRDRWLVTARQDCTEGTLTTRRIWLQGERSGRAAVLLSYGAAGRTPPQAFPPGPALDAEVAYYPGGQPLRAVLGEQFGTSPGGPPSGSGPAAALQAYAAALRGDPWLDAWPVVLSGVVPVPGAAGAPGDTGWQVADPAAGAGDAPALPVDPRAPATGLWRLASVSGGRPVTVFGLCGHRGFLPLTAWTPGSAEGVAL